MRSRTPRSRLVLALSVLALGLAACTAPGTAPDVAPTPAASSAPTTAPTAATTTGSATPAPGGTPTSTSATPSATPAPGCAALVGRLTLDERVGQLLMVAVTSTGVTGEQLAAVRGTAAGSVILLGNSTAGIDGVQRVVRGIRDAAARPQGVEVLLVADQEGGLVQRLKGPGFSDIPSAVRQAELSDADLTDRAGTWGDELVSAGIDADLAPVADVVPADLVQTNEPVGRLRRGYGSSPAVVADKVAAFTAGMDDAGVATAVKHFPGLGRVRGNTDTASDVVDRVTTRDDPALRGFRAAVDAGVDMVMVSSAIYSRIDPRRLAVFSPVVVVGMIREDLGFDGVVVSDDLAAAAVRDVPAGERVVRFLAAGGDLAIVGDPAEARTMAGALRSRAERDPAFATLVDDAATRVLTMKQRRGLAGC